MGAESATVRQFDLERNVITICFNKPDTPDEIDQVVPSNRNHTLATLKASIAEYVGTLACGVLRATRALTCRLLCGVA